MNALYVPVIFNVLMESIFDPFGLFQATVINVEKPEVATEDEED